MIIWARWLLDANAFLFDNSKQFLFFLFFSLTSIFPTERRKKIVVVLYMDFCMLLHHRRSFFSHNILAQIFLVYLSFKPACETFESQTEKKACLNPKQFYQKSEEKKKSRYCYCMKRDNENVMFVFFGGRIELRLFLIWPSWP